MSNVHEVMIRADPATAPPPDPVLALRILRRRFPTVCLWFGTSTRHWWAVCDGHLLEARTPEELGRRIDLAEHPP